LDDAALWPIVFAAAKNGQKLDEHIFFQNPDKDLRASETLFLLQNHIFNHGYFL